MTNDRLPALDDDTLPLLDADRRLRDSIHTALLEDKTPEILFHEDAIGETELDEEDEEEEEEEEEEAKNGVRDDVRGQEEVRNVVVFKSSGRVGSKEKWGLEPVAMAYQMYRVGITISEHVVVKVEGFYIPEEEEEKEEEEKKEEDTCYFFDLEKEEVIVKVHLFRIHREIHAIQFVTNERVSMRFGEMKHGELCKAVEAPEGKYFASFFGDLSRSDKEIDLGFRFADRPECKEDTMETEIEVAEIDHVN